jgi:hypothetical protein
MHLQALTAPGWEYYVSTEDELQEFSLDLPTSAYSGSDLLQLASCCPGLQDLTLTIQESVPLSPLAALPALRSLCVHGVNDTSMMSLAALTQLTELKAKVADGVDVTGLLRLTALQDLRHLDVNAEAVEATGAPAQWRPVKADYSCTVSGTWLLPWGRICTSQCCY